jgi:hypothetical protein
MQISRIIPFWQRWRRPAAFAAVTFLTLSRLLPTGPNLQRVSITNTNGEGATIVALRDNDPVLQNLIGLASTGGQRVEHRSDDYFRSKWEMEVSAIYGADPRNAPVSHDAAVTHDVATTPSSVILQTSYSVPGNGSADKSSVVDWQSFWQQKERESSQRVQQTITNANRGARQNEIRLLDTVTMPRPVATVALMFALTAIAFVMVHLWGRSTPTPLLSLTCNHQIMVPRRWMRTRRRFSIRQTGQSMWIISESMAWIAVAALAIG